MIFDENTFKKVPRGNVSIKAHRDFLLQVLEDNQEEFKRRLYEMSSEDPKNFLRIYTDLSKALIPRQQDVNVSMTLNNDFQALQALASSGNNGTLIEGERLGPPAIESLTGELNDDDFI